MAIRIAVGDESFDEIRKAGLYYVDKTELLYDLVGKTNNKVTLFTRPRRFGKTLNMSMMESFFDINRDSSALFKDLEISKREHFCSEWMNQYPVLSISFKDVDGLEFESAYDKLKFALADYCKKIAWLGENENTDGDDRAIFARLKAQNATGAEVQNFFKTIMRMMYAVYNRPVILLIDEYDVPLAKASEKNTAQNRYYVQMLDVMKGMLSIALKTNEYLKFAVVTGCLRIAKESIFTGTNNFASYSVLDNQFSRYFGFTQDEVDRLLEAAELSDKAELFKLWYDGYIIGKTPVYCPWDVVSYISTLQYDPEARPKNFWRNTSGNGVIRDFAARDDLDVTGKFETLMNGGSIVQSISDELTYDSLHETEENLWSVLLMTGYLTRTGEDADRDQVALRIPNAEILGIFEDTVIKLFNDRLDREKQQDLMRALWAGECDIAGQLLSDFLWDTISFHDYHEDYYHAFLAGIFVGLGYAVESNRESGLGRFDVLIKDRKNRRAMIIEAKKADRQDRLEAECDAALQQIKKKGYDSSIADGYETIICYGIAFYKKTANIKSL